MANSKRWSRERTGGKPGRWGLGLLLALGLTPGSGLSQVVDCLLAEVDHQAVTLSEIRVRDAFGISSGENQAEVPPSRRALLERVIDLKIVIEFARGEVAVTPAELSSALAVRRAELPAGEFEARLAAFGLRPGDLEPYLEEDLLFRKIIDQRFGRGVAVTLEEIRSLYEQTYVPAQKDRGLEPEPLISVLDKIEEEIRNAKIAVQVRTWIDGLRSQAEVVFKNECLKILEEE